MKRILILVVFTIFAISACSDPIVRKEPEPAVHRTSFYSQKICVVKHWYRWIGISYEDGCFFLHGVLPNDKADGKRVYLVYQLEEFDLDYPEGVSLNLDGVYYNLEKVETDYRDNIQVISRLTDAVMERISSAKKVHFSFSTSANTTNIEMTDSDLEDLKEAVSEMQKQMGSTPSMQIRD